MSHTTLKKRVIQSIELWLLGDCSGEESIFWFQEQSLQRIKGFTSDERRGESDTSILRIDGFMVKRRRDHVRLSVILCSWEREEVSEDGNGDTSAIVARMTKKRKEKRRV